MEAFDDSGPTTGEITWNHTLACHLRQTLFPIGSIFARSVLVGMNIACMFAALAFFIQ
jgi:hypothetical protein